MKYRYKEKTYCHGSYPLTPLKPGDDWIAEGVVRFHLPAMLIDIELRPEDFILGEIAVADYEAEVSCHDTADDEEPLSEPVVAVEYGPGDWRVIDGWGRMGRAIKTGTAYLPAWRLPFEQAIIYLVEEEDVRRFIEHWNFKTAWWERHDRIHGFPQEGPNYTTVCVDAEATWQAILEAAAAGEVEIPIRWNRWFAIHGDGTKLLIGEAKHMAPVCPLTFDRPVRKKEYLEVFSLYEEWEQAADEEPVRKRARRITISYEYIFAMIRQYAKGESNGK
jgi:hypothetical protein